MPLNKGHNLSLAGIVAETSDGIQLELTVRENLPNNRLGAVMVIPKEDKPKLSKAVEKAWKGEVKDLDKAEVCGVAEAGKAHDLIVEDGDDLLILTARQHTIKGMTRVVHISDKIRDSLAKAVVKAYRATNPNTDK